MVAGGGEPTFGGPTLGEVWRRLEAIERRDEKAHRDQDDRLTTALAQLVRSDVWQAEHSDLEDRIERMERARAERTTYERNLMVAIVASVLTNLGLILSQLVH